MQMIEEHMHSADDKQGLSEEHLKLLEERRHLLAERERLRQLLRQRDHEIMQRKEKLKQLVKEERNQDMLYAAALIIERDCHAAMTCSAQFLARC